MTDEPKVEVYINGKLLDSEALPFPTDPLTEARGIIRAIRIITSCAEGESILTHVARIVRRYKLFVDANGGRLVP